MADPRGWIATGFGSGLPQFAPGTWGTLAALPFCFALGYAQPWVYLLVTALVFALGCWAAGWVIRTFDVEDPGVVVIDEWVGMALTWFPAAYFTRYAEALVHPLWVYLLPAFLAFRLCDIVKPWPASWADQKLSGGFGAMLDDALAGLWACGFIWLAMTAFH